MLVALVTGHKLVIVVNFVLIQRGTPESVWPCPVKFAYRKLWPVENMIQSYSEPYQSKWRPPLVGSVPGGPALRSKFKTQQAPLRRVKAQGGKILVQNREGDPESIWPALS